MRVIRSWPQQVPDGRAYVFDELPRLLMTGHDYHVLNQIDDDVLLIEWDLAVGQEELQAFAGRAAADPDVPLVAPYRLYASSSGKPNKPAWAHRRYVRGDMFTEFIEPGDEFCHLFGFGLVYLPRQLVVDYLAAKPDAHFNDVSFSAWHYHNGARPNVGIDWNARPAHVHYDSAAIAAGIETQHRRSEHV